MQTEDTRTMDRLERLLDHEYSAIMDGAFEVFGQIAKDKEELLDGRKLTAPNHKVLGRLRRKAARNHQLLEAAIRGVRTVTDRLENLRNGHSGLNTYDRSGQRSTLGGVNKGNLQHRA